MQAYIAIQDGLVKFVKVNLIVAPQLTSMAVYLKIQHMNK